MHCPPFQSTFHEVGSASLGISVSSLTILAMGSKGKVNFAFVSI